MAISGFPDWSLTALAASSIYSGQCRTNRKRKPINVISFFTPSFETLPYASLLCFNNINSSPASASASTASPILEEEPSTSTLPVVLRNSRLEDDQPLVRYDDAGSLNRFLCRLLQDPDTQELAYDYYSKAKEQRQDFRPQRSMIKLLMSYFIGSKKWNLILLSVSDDFNKYNVLPDIDTCSRLVSSCIKARKFKIVESLLEVFKFSSEIAVSACYSAMRGYNALHMYGSTISVYERMKLAAVSMDSWCYCQIMKAYQKIGDTDKVVELFHEFESRKLDAKPVLGQIYGILCESLGKSGRAFEALEYFRDMTNKGFLADSSIYSLLICSFASIREVSVAEELFKEAQEKKMLRKPETFLNLVLVYVEEGLMEKTLEVVEAMKSANIKVSDCIFCAIINGFSKKRGYRAAVRVYEELKVEGLCEPGQVTYASIINACCRIGLYSKAELVFLEMEEKGFDKCVVAYSSIISMYGKTGRLRDAMRLMAKMKLKGCEPNVWIYNSLLDMHGRVKNLRQVEKLWKEMKRRKVAPDKVTYTSIISTYSKAKEYETCLKFYNEYRINGGVIDRAMAGIMVGVFAKINRIDELLKLLRDMKSEGTALDGRLFRSALNALRDAGLDMQAKWLQESFETT